MTEAGGASEFLSGLLRVILMVGEGPLEVSQVLEISQRGMRANLTQALATDQEVGVELYHPILTGGTILKGRVAW